MSLKNILSFFFLSILTLQIQSQTIKTISLTRYFPYERHNSFYLFPALYENTMSDRNILDGLDTLPGKMKIYLILSKSDSSRYAILTMRYGTIGSLFARYGIIDSYENGNMKRVIVFNKEKKASKGYAEYYEDGRLATVGFYRRGNKHRKWIYYDDQGHLLKKEKYKNGVLIKQKQYDDLEYERTTPRGDEMKYKIG